MWNEKKIFKSLTPFSLLDFKNYPCAIVWFSGCNMRCEFCYNPDIVFSNGKYSFDDFLDFFKSRQSLLKGVVLCGGEPTIHKEIYHIAKELKKLNYKIKLDTNGINTKIIKKLIDEKLIDYIALDFKAPYDKFEQITKIPKKKYNDFLETLQTLIKNNIDFEIRTTYHEKLLTINDIYNMIKVLEKYNFSKTYYIQNFLDTNNTIGNIKETNNTNLSKIIKEKYKFPIKFRNF